MKKTILSLLLCFTLIVCIIPQSTYAQSSRDTSFEEELATDLKALGLFKGVSDTNFDLNREPTRIEALVMLIRVLGSESVALNGDWTHPFKDVPNWADKYVGYAYENGLTKGTSATTFGTENANSAMYITFMLRALGYSDVDGEDFTWDNPYMLAKKIGILPTFVDTSDFLRADVVTVSYAALRANFKGSETPLELILDELGVFGSVSFIEHYDMNAIGRREATLARSGNELTSKEIFTSCSPAVFYIDVWNESTKTLEFAGSGFFITNTGIAITNYHVIENADAAGVWLQNKTGYSIVGVLCYDKELDFAIVKTNATNVPYVQLGNSDSLLSGEKIYAIGNPQGLMNTISDGIVSNPNRDDFNGMIQITAPISPGSSGGALLNSRGEVIGITTATLTSGQNLNFAVPINAVVSKKELPDIETKYSMITMEEFAALEKPVGIADPIGFLQDFLVEYGTADALTGVETIVSYSVKMEAANGDVFTISYTPNTGYMYIRKEYSTNFNKISANLYLSGAGTNESATKAVFSFRNDTEWTEGFGFVSRELVKYPEYFSFYSMMELEGKSNSTLSQEAGEEICYRMILDIIDAADYMFSYYNLPITMRDFGYVY